MDTKIWDAESDRYTARAIKSSNNKLYKVKNETNLKISRLISTYAKHSRKVLDIGCGYGQTIFNLKSEFEDTTFYGLDPGKNSIDIANKNVSSEKVFFQQGFSHDLPFGDDEFDIVTLLMVLQWIPRSKLIKSIAEVDRVLRPGGIIVVQDFLTHKPVTSQSRHDEDIYIFKEDYKRAFTGFPWFKEIFREVTSINDGEDQQRSISVILKHDLRDVYNLKTGATE